MRYHLTLIEILYNPASYCDKTWLTLSDAPAKNISILPAYMQNHLLLKHPSPEVFCETDVKNKAVVDLFINHWHHVQSAAWLIGLKMFSSTLLQQPLWMKKLSRQERGFLCLPIVNSLPAVALKSTELTHDDITQSGASFIYSIAQLSLPAILVARLKMIFPTDFNYATVPIQNVSSSLSALKWAFDYA
ncbi:hypothetical protein [Enterobacter sp. ENT03]|uniref:hypothetical protein n=1 Tax=Enterobacter sp. ENT03 TaxID=2854780 RepID=UPI001C4923A6|nr:hypothetical protein [Enterobacter sp. ENT03]MBV7405635.1 hypothetical protein [Enterobacter sp. ENT03]